MQVHDLSAQTGSIRLSLISLSRITPSRAQTAPRSLSPIVLHTHTNPTSSSSLTCQSPEVAVCTSFKLRVHITCTIYIQCLTKFREARLPRIERPTSAADLGQARPDSDSRNCPLLSRLEPQPGGVRWLYLKLSMTGNTTTTTTGFADLIDSSCN